MIVGFTGTQVGMTKEQSDKMTEMCSTLAIHQFHHGDCIGSDEQAHHIVRMAYGVSCTIHIHPPISSKLRAWKHGDVVYIPKAYLERNKDIAAACALLIATPHSMLEELRSGTWATIRYARKLHKSVSIIYPDGTVRSE